MGKLRAPEAVFICSSSNMQLGKLPTLFQTSMKPCLSNRSNAVRFAEICSPNLYLTSGRHQ